MIRVGIAIAGLASWLIASLGLRAWFGGKAYLLALFGSERFADALFESALAHSFSVGGVDMRPIPLLMTVSIAVSVVLVAVLLWPIDSLLRHVRAPRVLRTMVAAGIAIGLTAAGLLSVHPLLAQRSVPEGPRTILNFACEAAGYDWINGIAYVGAIATAVAFVWFAPAARARRVDEAKVPTIPADTSEPVAPADEVDAVVSE